MKVAGISICSPYQNYRNNDSSNNDKHYIDKQNVDNITFMANVGKLNKAVFVQRNIIKQEDSLGTFVDRIFDKIYQYDYSSNYELFIHPKLQILYNDIDNISYKNIIPFIKSSKSSVLNPEHFNMHEQINKLIHKSTEYHQQCIEAINKVRSNAYDILAQYGFIPEKLHDIDVTEKSDIYKRFDELLKNPSIKKKSENDYDILLLADKDKTGTTIKLQRKPTGGFDLKWNRLYEISLSDISYKDSKINYRTSDSLLKPTVKLKVDDGNELEFEYLMPRKEIFRDYDNKYLVDKEINSLKSQPDRNHWKYIEPFFDIKDRTNNIIYTFQKNNGIDKLLSVYDVEKNILLADIKASKNKSLSCVEDTEIAIGTSLYTNLLQPKKPMGACIVLPYDIMKNQKAIKQELEPHIINGVGTGFDLSETKEPVKVLTSLNEILNEYHGKTQRPPAGIATLDVTHNDILKFIDAKRNADFDKWRFNISVSVPNEFMEKVANNEKFKLTDGKEVPAKNIYTAIIKSMHRCGEPGIVFKDNVEAANPLPNHKYKGMASCAEIGLENGEMCLFSHINLSKFLDKDSNEINFCAMGQATETLSKALDNVIDINLSEKVGENNIASQKRRFGIGVCGFADLLASMKIPYGSKHSREILAQCLEVINYHSKKASMELAKEKGKFPLYDESRYNEKDFLIKQSHTNFPIGKDLWNKLYEDIQKYGLRNATTTALPPTGSSSRIVDASYSIEPYFDLRNNKIFYEKLEELNLSEKQKQQVIDTVNNTGSCQDIEFLPERFRDVFRLGNEIDYPEHLRIVGTAQKFIDDGISKTVNFENSATTDDIDKAVKMAKDLKLKGIAVFRDGCLAERSK